MTAALVVALAVLAALAAAYARRRVTHPYSEAELRRARQVAARASRESSRGWALEHMAPYMPDFGFHPADCHHLGSPIDFVIFDGLHERKVVERILFREIKSGAAKLVTCQRQVRDAIRDGRVDFDVYRLAPATERTPVGGDSAAPAPPAEAPATSTQPPPSH